MTTLTISKTYCAICDKVSKLYTDLKEYYKAKRSYRRTFNTLSKLSDKDLNDIGICRGDISYIAKGGDVYRGRN
jgi:uncharacterized protein YjiS (DUF1127 family)